jgi:hypothetical protein
MLNLVLSEEEAVVLARDLTDITFNARYQRSSHQDAAPILRKLRLGPARPAASPAPRVYEPPSKGRIGGQADRRAAVR